MGTLSCTVMILLVFSQMINALFKFICFVPVDFDLVGANKVIGETSITTTHLHEDLF